MDSLMNSKVRSSQGCWTCRLRRKKCDEHRPVCRGCGVLEITCHYGDDKPEWMDGGARQKEMSDRLKRQVKLQANHRRERKYLQGFEISTQATLTTSASAAGLIQDQDRGQDDDGGSQSQRSDSRARVPSLTTDSSRQGSHTSPSTSQNTPPPDLLSMSTLQIDVEHAEHEHPRPALIDLTPPPADAQVMMLPVKNDDSFSSVPSPMDTGDPGGFLNEWKPREPTTSSPVREDESDMNLVMVYLDHVFPFLFPFYNPSLLEGGRGWLISLLRSNRAVYHTALCLSAYFFSHVVHSSEHDEPEPGPCQKMHRRVLQEQHDLALQELQSEMAAINARGVRGHVRESIRVLNSIIQLLIFDVAAGNASQWLMHVDAAISLFQQIVPQPLLWRECMAQVGFPSRIVDSFASGHTLPWTTEQAALRTFGGALFLVDILAATAAARRPRLQDWHASILDIYAKPDPKADSRLLIRLETLFGCQTWVMHLLGEIAGLDAWKKENKRGGSLSMTQLVSRAATIEYALRQGIACLDGQCTEVDHDDDDDGGGGGDGDGNGCNLPHPTHVETAGSIPSSAMLQWQKRVEGQSPVSQTVRTKIWAYASLTYLSIVVSGWQPSCPETAASVTAAMDLFAQMEWPVCIRSLVWPFTVIGCLAPPSQHDSFRLLACQLGPLGSFGSVKSALAIMENVWARGDSIDQSWDIAACLQSLGPLVLLI